MAEKCFPTLQELRGFGIDADVWRKFINGEIDEVNLNRNGVDVETLLAWKEQVMEVARQAANMQTYLTKAEMEAAGPQPKGTVAQVTNDPDPANNGYWVSDGLQWIWSGIQPATYLAATRNGYIITGRLTKRDFDATTNIWTISHTDLRIDLGAGRSFVRVQAAENVQVPINRAYFVNLTGASAGSVLAAQVTDSDPASASFGFGAFVDDARMPLFYPRGGFGANGLGGLLAFTVVNRESMDASYREKLEVYPVTGRVWQRAVTGTRITFDPSTRILAWDGSILLPIPFGTANRVMLGPGSIEIPSNTLNVVYLDLSRVPANGNADYTQAVRVGRYLDAGDNAFTGAPHQVPMFIRERVGEVRPAPGFFPVEGIAPPPSNTAVDRVLFRKSVADASFYIKGSGPNNYIEYKFTRTVVPFDGGVTANSQSDHWRIQGAYETDSDLNRLHGGVLILASGECECAMREAGGKPDAVGGYHGDELQTNSFFLLDGIYYDQTAVINADCKVLEFVQESVIYSCNTQIPICNHIKRYEITPQGIYLRQEFEWLRATELQDAWLAMFPIKRRLNSTTGAYITDGGVRMPGYAREDLSQHTSDGSARVFTEARDGFRMYAFAQSSGIAAEMHLVKTPGLPNADAHFSDASAYNKMYFDAKGQRGGTPTYTAQVGEKWVQETVYKLDTKN
ncbi:MAG: hypothetical protein ACTMIU_12950 [Alcaligenes aquatilis]